MPVVGGELRGATLTLALTLTAISPSCLVFSLAGPGPLQTVSVAVRASTPSDLANMLQTPSCVCLPTGFCVGKCCHSPGALATPSPEMMDVFLLL